MARLTELSTDDLRAELRTYEAHRPMTRLLAAIIYTEGPTVPEIAQWLDVREATVYRWFDRLEAEPIPAAVTDRERPGRPSKLSAAAWDRFRRAVRGSPTAVGFEMERWTPELARAYLADECDTDYSRRHARRLLERARDDAARGDGADTR